MKLYDNGVNLVYINEPYINTIDYKDATKTMVPMTGIETARRKGKQIGRARGVRIDIKKAKICKKKMLKLSKSFGGGNTDKELIAMLGIDKNTFYKYKKELLTE